MRNSSLTRLLLHKTSRTFHDTANAWNQQHLSKWKATLKEELAVIVPNDRENACIYRVPVNMREVQPDAYAPTIISIGPYHLGQERLQAMEELKWKFFHRLFRPKQPNGVELDPAMNAMEDLEQDARRCYWDNAEQHSKDKFVRMMLVDGCFIVELLRELKHNNFQCAPSVQRWMLPTLRRDLIMLENQLPLFVLQKLFELTKRSEESSTCLEQLALCFFNPLLQSQRDVRAVNAQGIQNTLHFLDLFRQSILPFPINLSQGLNTSKTSDSSNAAEEGIDMVRSMTELMEAGVVIEKAVNCPPLDVSSQGRWLKVPPLYVDDHKGTLFRNMVAYEQCHPKCKPYVTSYLFFFDGLINSAEDVGFLHHKGVLHHCLGSNKEVAKLLNGLCKEIAMDGRESYLCKVVHDMNTYCNGSYAWFRAGQAEPYTAKAWNQQHLSKWKATLKEELAVIVPNDRENACIYRVPVNMREVQPDAYAPTIISIGPYHLGQERLQAMEELKWKFFHRLFRPKQPNGVELDPAMKAMEDLEQDARRCY
ncbi:hypothetical protein CXB51_007354 [Gossypium anomalum]|uniref:Uncharacterized protein n=1 Tax=Gossypium anomalum TaxID=47600 RepID=A0A8J5ZKP7_9ROSI|nr:hypothetical protein CXB51_007354 [Gossypium anomalum]